MLSKLSIVEHNVQMRLVFSIWDLKRLSWVQTSTHAVKEDAAWLHI